MGLAKWAIISTCMGDGSRMGRIARYIKRLTKRAADKWESPRFLGLFLARGWFRFEGESTLRPLAANAHRWAARMGNATQGKE